ncbi:MAG TPA: SHOCT domain-containing protein [Methylomirabilota bacterium]|nr:SHOCT domain-containing protein [Methylomirabilota bacterium]
MNQEEKKYEGYNGTLILTNTGIIIKRGMKGVLLGGGALRGDKSIPYSSIVAVQLKKAGLTAGYIQLTLMGGSGTKSGLFQSTRDDNSINFHARNNEKFEEAKKLIEERVTQIRQGTNTESSNLTELEKLAELRDKGIITEAEFQQKKKQLLGL